MAFVVTAVTAVGAAIATTTIVTVAAAVAAVGMAMTVVGVITGSKTLMKIGGILSLAGGITGFAAGAMSSAGAAAVAEGTVGSASAEAAANALTGTAAEPVASLVGDVASNSFTQPALMADPIASVAEQAASPMQSLEVDPIATSRTSEVIPTQATETIAGTGRDALAVDGAQGPSSVQARDVTYNADDFMSMNNSPMPIGTAPVKPPGMLDRFNTFATKNKGILDMGMKVVGGSLDGMNKNAQFNENQKTKQQEINLRQQEIDQRKFGNTVSSFRPRSIINGARA